MDRRTFSRLAVAGTAALTAGPLIGQVPNEPSYTLEELMGIGRIPLVGKDYQLRETPFNALKEMKLAAYKEGFDLKVVSAFRSYQRQKEIWEGKYYSYTIDENLSPLDAAARIVEYSTIPGTSRHHWGTDVDIIDGYPRTNGDVLVPDKFEGEGPFAPFKKWLDDHANSFGFYLVYTDNPKRKGFNYEPWHYSYAPLAIPMLNQFRKKNILKALLAADFEGSSELGSTFLRDYIHNHILNINPALL